MHGEGAGKRGERLSPLREKKGVCGVCGFL